MTKEELALEQTFMTLRAGNSFDRELLRLFRDAALGDDDAVTQIGELEDMYAKINHG